MENNSKSYFPHTELIPAYSNVPQPALPNQSTTQQPDQPHPHRSQQHFLSYAMSSNITMSQSLMSYNNQSAYNIMYGSQGHIYPTQNTFPPPSFNTYNTQMDAIPWLTETYPPNKRDTKLTEPEKRPTDQITDTIGIGLCSPLSDSFKSVVYNSEYHPPPPHWYYNSNYSAPKSFESLPSCSQLVDPPNPCCREFNMCSETSKTSHKYCRIQQHLNDADPNICNTTSENKAYPSCQVNNGVERLLLLGGLEEEQCDELRMDCCNTLPSSDFFPSAADINNINLDLYDRNDETIRQRKDSKPASQCGGESDDIIVEESVDDEDDSASSVISDVDETSVVVYVCLVCNLTSTSSSGAMQAAVVFFQRLDDDTLLTRTTQTPLMDKLKSITQHSFSRSLADYICNLCLDLVNTIDCLEFKLNERRERLIAICEKTNSTLQLTAGSDTNDKTMIDVCENENSLEENANKDKVIVVEPPLAQIDELDDSIRSDTNNDHRRICKICNKYFCHSDIHRHKQLHASHINFKCTLCHRSFTMKRLLDNHMKRHSGQRDFLCHHCGKTYIKKHSLDLHIRRHAKSFRYFCNECGKGFLSNTALEIHRRTHTDLKPFQCDICKKKFRTSSHLKEHVRYCSGDLPFSCDQCEKKFASVSKRNDHVKLKHEKNFKIICEKCSMGFTRDSDYKAHLTTHSDERPHKCSTCAKAYKTVGNLHHHEKIHKQTLYKCDVCAKKFLRKENWEAHKSVHTGMKPFACTICEKKFAIKKHLDAHIARLHNNGTIKKHTCPVCNKELVHGLEEHIRLHSGDKPFKCDICLMRFTSSGALRKHTKRKHENL